MGRMEELEQPEHPEKEEQAEHEPGATHEGRPQEQYVFFRAGETRVATLVSEVLRVLSNVPPVPVTRVPHVPKSVEGVINSESIAEATVMVLSVEPGSYRLIARFISDSGRSLRPTRVTGSKSG